jgi:hypothetical protein
MRLVGRKLSPLLEEFDNSRKLTNETPGEKILLMKRNVSNGTNNALSPFLVTRAVEGVAQRKVSKISWLRDGSVLIMTMNLNQAERLMRLIALANGRGLAMAAL